MRTYSAEAYGSAFLRRETFNSYCLVGEKENLFLQALLRRQLGRLLDCKKSVMHGWISYE